MLQRNFMAFLPEGVQAAALARRVKEEVISEE